MISVIGATGTTGKATLKHLAALAEIYDFFAQGHAQFITDTVQRVTGKPAAAFEQFARDHADAFR